jgi:hypothetical protein
VSDVRAIALPPPPVAYIAYIALTAYAVNDNEDDADGHHAPTDTNTQRRAQLSFDAMATSKMDDSEAAFLKMSFVVAAATSKYNGGKCSGDEEDAYDDLPPCLAERARTRMPLFCHLCSNSAVSPAVAIRHNVAKHGKEIKSRVR